MRDITPHAPSAILLQNEGYIVLVQLPRKPHLSVDIGYIFICYSFSCKVQFICCFFVTCKIVVISVDNMRYMISPVLLLFHTRYFCFSIYMYLLNDVLYYVMRSPFGAVFVYVKLTLNTLFLTYIVFVEVNIWHTLILYLRYI